MTHDKSYVEKDYKVVGSRVKRPDGIDKVTGKALYGADLYAPNMLVGKMLRINEPHALIKSINTSKAEKVPGVKSVITFQDFKNVESFPVSPLPRRPRYEKFKILEILNVSLRAGGISRVQGSKISSGMLNFS